MWKPSEPIKPTAWAGVFLLFFSMWACMSVNTHIKSYPNSPFGTLMDLLNPTAWSRGIYYKNCNLGLCTLQYRLINVLACLFSLLKLLQMNNIKINKCSLAKKKKKSHNFDLEIRVFLKCFKSGYRVYFWEGN